MFNETQTTSLKLGLPSLLVAVIALALAAFGYWMLPQRLPDQYARHLKEYQQQYGQAESLSDEQLFLLGSSIDICYTRLETLAPSEIDRLEQAEFLENHAQLLRNRLKSPAGGELRDDLEQQLAEFREHYQQLVEGMAAAESPESREANLWLAQRALADGRVDQAESIAMRLTEYLHEHPDDDELRIALARLAIERVWFAASQTAIMQLDRQQLAAALEIVDKISDAHAAEKQGLQLEILCQTDVPQAQVLAAQAGPDPSETGVEKLKIVRSVVIGDWEKTRKILASYLSTAREDEQRQLRVQTARSIARLFFSELAVVDGKWCTSCPDGLHLAFELHPASPELCAIVWQCALQHAEQRESLPPVMLESILISNSSPERYLILAISNALKDLPADAKIYVKLALGMDRQTLGNIANVVVWYAQRETERGEQLSDLVKAALEIEDNGSLWFALATVQLQQQRFSDAERSLQQARLLLGEQPTILQLLDIAQQGSQQQAPK